MIYTCGMGVRTPDLPFDLRSLEIFLAVCETGAMAGAARRLRISQPAVSIAVAELERKIGSSLFDRGVRPLTLTTAGGLLRQRASALVADARQIPPLLREAKLGKVPSIRVGLVDSLCRLLTVRVAEYLGSRADEVSVLSGLTATHASDLLTRRLDVFLGVDDLIEIPGLERWAILREPYVLLLPRGAAPVRTIGDLKKLASQFSLIRFSARSQTGLEVERHLRRLGLNLAQHCEFDTPYGVAAMVTAGRAFAITTPLCISEAALAMTGLVTARLPGPQISRTLTLVARHRELGTLPRDLAQVARKALEKTAAASMATGV